MDREGEQELVATLKTLAVDHTAIVISHSPALLSACDQVLVMQRGRVVRSGRPEDVLPPQLLVGSGHGAIGDPAKLNTRPGSNTGLFWRLQRAILY